MTEASGATQDHLVILDEIATKCSAMQDALQMPYLETEHALAQLRQGVTVLAECVADLTESVRGMVST